MVIVIPSGDRHQQSVLFQQAKATLYQNVLGSSKTAIKIDMRLWPSIRVHSGNQNILIAKQKWLSIKVWYV